MDLKAMREFMALQKQAEAQGKPLTQVLEEEIKKEEKRLGDAEKATVTVQIMPHNVVGGYGKFPAVVMMPRDKAVELANLGTVKIVIDPDDEVSEEDEAAIQEHVDEMMAIRKSREKRPKQKMYVKKAQLTNVVPFERLEAIDNEQKVAQEENKTIIVEKSELIGALAPESRRAAKA